MVLWVGTMGAVWVLALAPGLSAEPLAPPACRLSDVCWRGTERQKSSDQSCTHADREKELSIIYLFGMPMRISIAQKVQQFWIFLWQLQSIKWWEQMKLSFIILNVYKIHFWHCHNTKSHKKQQHTIQAEKQSQTAQKLPVYHLLILFQVQIMRWGI